MTKADISLIVSVLISVALAVLISIAGSDGGATAGGIPVFAICGLLAFAINWVAFVPANQAGTEHYYDITGSVTYLTIVLVAALLSGDLDERAVIVAILVTVWALRLGSFLFLRIKRDGKDDRFDEIKVHPLRFFLAWTLQALWVLLTAACALAVITGGTREPLGWLGVLGIAVWLFGFAVEVTADQQKSAFKRDPANAGRFINSGLWAWSRHPNYFGEIVLWSGIAIIALPVLSGWQWVTLISPVFVFLLIRYVSGVNKLEEKAEQKWGQDPAYQQYRDNTPLLMLRPPKA